ncbi:MAG: succinate dehydrogenase assembly factor 2 [Burkholderiales bacterium]|jgi:antitoxin CptB
MSLVEPAAAIVHQSDPAQRRRLRWRARRGLLENDLLLTRFLDQHESSLSDEEVEGLDGLLALTDNELLDLILARTELQDGDSQGMRRVLEQLRKA